MADRFSIAGSWSTKPSTGSPSSDPELTAPLDEAVTLGAKLIDTISLDTDDPVTVGFGGLSSAAVVVLRATGAKITARLTSADGAMQVVPVDPLLVLIARSVPIMAITVTREAGLTATVKVFLGQKS